MALSKEFFSKDYYFGRKSSNYFDYNDWDSDLFWGSVIKIIKKYKISGRMLDIGCALGFLVKRMVPFFEEVHGVDISEFAIKRARKEAKSAKFELVDINKEELNYSDNYFDLITALDVLEHTDSIEESLKKIIPKLKDNGYLLISVPIKDTWLGRIFNYFDRDKSHVSVPTRKELFQIISNTGLEIIQKHYFTYMKFFKLRGIPVIIEILLKK